MGERLPVTQRARFAYDRARGVPIISDLRPYRRIVREVRAIDLHSRSDEALFREARAMRERRRERDLILCLALACEASRRRLGLEPYDEQIMAAAVLCEGKVAQLQTGEGKTLAAALAASFGAMDGLGLHIVTANDYLAARDAEWMGPIYAALGLSVASVGDLSSSGERQAAYAADLTYLTARELGFDYLRDSLACSSSEVAQRPFSKAIVDEADFVLIDEARIPLVIAGEAAGDGLDLREIDRTAQDLLPGLDYRVDREGRSIALLDRGRDRAARILGCGSEGLPDEAKARLFASLHARGLLEVDVDYVVKDGKVKLVDAFTGRVAERRQWPWGIQAAIEAKEGLEIGREGSIRGSITIQHLMSLYPSIAAMTATAVPAAEELSIVYGMATVVIPPARPSIRVDLPDAVFMDRASKDRALVAEIAEANGAGRPVLVGTQSVRESEGLARALSSLGIACSVLNAKDDGKEAQAIAGAGGLGAVTISTNMAGRGTDIRLGPDPRIRELGGLYVIGSGKHESRRVDDQLRGRAGRQGDPGTTRFFISLDDALFARYGVRAFLPEDLGASASGRIEDPACLGEIERAQRIIEGQNSQIRRGLLKRSLIVEFDRRYLRMLRDRALSSSMLPEAVEAALGADAPAAGSEARRKMVGAFLARADAAWAGHLALIEDVKEGIGLQRYGGKDPHREYLSIAAGAFEDAMRELEESSIEDCRAILAGEEISSGPRLLPARPSSTWTYAVDEEALPGFDLGQFSGAAALALGPFALPLFLVSAAARALSARTSSRSPRRGYRAGRRWRRDGESRG